MGPRYAPEIFFSKGLWSVSICFLRIATSNALSGTLSKPPDSALMIIEAEASRPDSLRMFAFFSTYAAFVPVPRMKPM